MEVDWFLKLDLSSFFTEFFWTDLKSVHMKLDAVKARTSASDQDRTSAGYQDRIFTRA